MDLNKIAADCNSTEPLYITQMDTQNVKVSITRIVPDKGQHCYLILDKTIFHPKGGGQPSDKGIVRSPEFEANVKKAIAHHDVIIHWVKIVRGKPNIGLVECELDWPYRHMIMRKHSAAHLLDHCLAKTTKRIVRTTDSWLGDDSYVGYDGLLPGSSELSQIEALANEIIRNGAEITISHVSRQEASTLADAPNFERLPDLNTIRIVKIEGCSPIPCGGTHVSNVSQIGQLSLLGTVRTSKTGFRIYFRLPN